MAWNAKGLTIRNGVLSPRGYRCPAMSVPPTRRKWRITSPPFVVRAVTSAFTFTASVKPSRILGFLRECHC